MNAKPGRFQADPERVEAVPKPGPAAVAVPDAEPAEAAPRPRRKLGRRLLMALVPLLLLVGGGAAWLTGGRYVDTDNAYVHQPIVPISADVAGRIVAVSVAENQVVKAGDTVFRLDPEPFRIALDRAEAALASARLSVGRLRSAHDTAEARLAAAREIRDIRKTEYERQQSLSGRGVASTAALDEARLAWQAAENDVILAEQGVKDAAAALGGDPDIDTDAFPAVAQAEAEVAAAHRDLAATTVHAPVPGVIAQIESLNVGQYVTTGTMAASVVESDQTWIEANFKETQLGGLKVGQPVAVEVDAYPDLTLAGTVESIGAATGSQYALIPAQNATGNWVKVVQRLSVRIRVEPDAGHPLHDGMSVHVSVDTGRSRLDGLL